MIVTMYRTMYTTLFNAVTEALGQMAKGNYIEAESLLKKAQQETEETYILWEEQEGGMPSVSLPGDELYKNRT